MRLGFHTKQLTERGTEVALFDYALAASQTLGHDVTVFVPAETPKIIPAVKRRFEEHFELVLYSTPRDINCDALYVIKRGAPGLITDRIPELVHSFHDVSHPHGHRFATVSDWVSQTAVHQFRLPRGRVVRVPKRRKPPVVPHIVTLPDVTDDFREVLSLPAEAVVFGRHGGVGTFSIEFVKDAIRVALEARDDIWFLFINVEPFCKHARVIHLPQMTEPCGDPAFRQHLRLHDPRACNRRDLRSGSRRVRLRRRPRDDLRRFTTSRATRSPLGRASACVRGLRPCAHRSDKPPAADRASPLRYPRAV